MTEDPVLATRAGIRRRGSSSGNWPKYSLSVETWRDGDDEDRNIKPLGLAREADWILNARYEWDLTLLRNPFVYEISRQIGRYAPRTPRDRIGHSVHIEQFLPIFGGCAVRREYAANPLLSTI